jgi:hypothetical protein
MNNTVVNERTINLKQIESFLESINYRFHSNEKGKFKINIDEIVEPFDCNDEFINIRLTRKVIIEPANLFSLEVSFVVRGKFDESDKAFFQGDKDKIYNFVEKNKYEIIKNQTVCSQSSLLIAQITSFLNMNPVILPPRLLSNK